MILKCQPRLEKCKVRLLNVKISLAILTVTGEHEYIGVSVLKAIGNIDKFHSTRTTVSNHVN